MERRAKVEPFERIRREYEFGVGTIEGVAAKLGVHLRMARQALASAEPPPRKTHRRERPVIGPLRPFIDGILEADRNAPRKQRHTAHRICQRIRSELPDYKVAEATVRVYVRQRKHELGWSIRETCVPQSYAPGQEGQVDWYEAWAELNGEPAKLRGFSPRSMMTGAAFHRACQRATQQAFLEAHEHAFHYFGGVFRLPRCDNLASAVKEGAARPSARGDRAVYRFPLALALRERLLHAGGAAREGRRRGRGRLLPPQSLGADS
jgi:transposase